MTARAAWDTLAGALDAIPKRRAYTDPGATVDPPGVMLAPPALTFDTFCPGQPTSATFLVYVIEKADARAVSRLLDSGPAVAAAIEDTTDGAVTQATPGSWTSGGTELPAYVITVEFPL